MDGMAPRSVQAMAFAQVNRQAEGSAGDRDCPLVSPGACPRCAPGSFLGTQALRDKESRLGDLAARKADGDPGVSGSEKVNYV